MLLEMHCHTSDHSSCCTVKAAELLVQVQRRGLQGVVITDHHFLWSEEQLQAIKRESQVPDYFLVLTGQEVSTSDMGHTLIYGADRAIKEGTSAVDIRTRYPGAALVLAHPYRDNRRPNRDLLLSPLVDGVEIFSSNHSVLENYRGLKDWHQYKFTALAGTDTHGRSYAGSYPTLFDHPIVTIDDLVNEIKGGRCRPFLRETPRSGGNYGVDEIEIGAGDERQQGGVTEGVIVRELRPHDWRSAKRAVFIMEEIARFGFAGGRFRVPRLIEGEQERMLLIEQRVPGRLLFDILISSSPEDRRFYVRLAAQWLAKLHNLRLQITAPKDFLGSEQHHFEIHRSRFEQINHPHTRRVYEILDTISRAESHLFKEHLERFIQGHGDFHIKNIIIGHDEPGKPESLFVAAIDFVNSASFPPSFDVGIFLAQFRNQLLDYPDILEEVPESVFVDAYATSFRVYEGFFKEVELFRARTDVSIMSYLISVGLGDSENLWRVLVEAERSLALYQLSA